MSKPRGPYAAGHDVTMLGSGITVRRAYGALPDMGMVPKGTEGSKTAEKPANRQKTASGDSPLAPIYAAMSEKQLQAMVVAGLRQRGYLVWVVPNMRMTAAGLPDVIAVHPTRVPRRVHFWELKRASGRIRPEQKRALAALSDVYGVDARVIRPADWPAVLEDL